MFGHTVAIIPYGLHRACTLAVLYYWTVYPCSVQIERITTWSTIMASSESQESSSSVSSASRYRVSSSEETYDVNESSSESSSRGLIAKKNTSCVWTYFGFVLVHLAIHSTAILLHVDYVSAKWSNTSNLLNHLKMHHPMEYTEVKRAQSATASSSSRITQQSKEYQTLQQCVGRSKKYSTSSSEHKN